MIEITEKDFSSELISRLSSAYRVDKIQNIPARVSFYDTFDRGLFKKNRILYQCGKEFRHYNFKSAQLEAAEIANINNRYFSYSDFTGRMKSSLGKITTLRAFIKIIDLPCFRKEITVSNPENGERQTICFLCMESPGQTYCLLLDCEDKKLPDEASELIKKIKKNPFSTVFFEQLIESERKIPSQYSSKINFNLEGDETVYLSSLIILDKLLITMRLNEEGIRADIDTEFLHDYRVASRRIRSYLSLTEGAFPGQTTRKIKKIFRSIHTGTNRLRDLDVLLLDRDYIISESPENHKKSLCSFFEIISLNRNEEYMRLRVFLESAQYAAIMLKVYSLITGSKPGPLGNSGTGDYSTSIIREKFLEVVKDISLFSPSSDVTDYHRLRINFKKLRYLVEFFSSIYPDKYVDIFIKKMKEYQDNLGRFNDLSVRNDLFSEYSSRTRNGPDNIGASLQWLIEQNNSEMFKLKEGLLKGPLSTGNQELIDLYNQAFN